MTILMWLRWVFLFNAIAFAVTGLLDIALQTIPSGLVDASAPVVITCVLRLAVAAVNVRAFLDVHREAGHWPQRPGARRRPWEFPSVIAGQASAVPILIVPFAIEIPSLAHNAGDIVVLVIAGLLLAAALFVLGNAFFTPTEVVLNRPWKVVIALLPFFGVFQFWYLTFHKPVHELPRVNVLAGLEQVGRDGGGTRMRGTVTLDNIGTATVDVFGAFYTVTGHGSGGTGAAMKPDAVISALRKPWKVAWQEPSDYRGLLKAGRLIRTGGHLTPGQKLLTSFVFDARDDAQDKLRLTVHLSLLTHTTELGEFTRCHPDPGPRTVCYSTPLPVQSWLRLVLGDRPDARTSFTFPAHGVPYLRTAFVYGDRKEKGLPEPQAGRFDPFVRSRGATSSVEYRLSPR
ncbi:hypothetical protein ACFQ6V_18315 [Streptomyces roseifaciens]